MSFHIFVFSSRTVLAANRSLHDHLHRGDLPTGRFMCHKPGNSFASHKYQTGIAY